MNHMPLMRVQSQIFQRHQNYVVWPQPAPPYPPQNPPVFPRPPAFNPYSGWVSRERNTLHPTGFRQGNPNRNSFHPAPANRSGRKGRRFRNRKRKSGGGDSPLEVPWAPHNTTSFLRRAWRGGGIPVSPSMPTPPTPPVTAAMELFKEHGGILDDYGSMEGTFRLRADSGEDSGGGGDGLAARLARLEWVPNDGAEQDFDYRVDDLETQIMGLKTENLTLKARIILMERELDEFRRRVHYLETDGVATASSDGGEVEDLAIADGDCSERSVGNDNGVSGGDTDGGNNDDSEDA